MSITKDFEAKEFDADNWNKAYLSTDVTPLLAHTRALEAMLKKHEWAKYDSDYGVSSCPECGADKPIYLPPRHAPNCQLPTSSTDWRRGLT